jgi:hypothetical protein
MISRDYMNQIGVTSGAPRLPLPVAIFLLALGGAALWFAVAKIRALPSSKTAVVEAPAAAKKPGMHAQATPR